MVVNHRFLILPPDHLVHDAGIGLYYLHDLRGDILVHVIRHRNPVIAGGIHGDGGVHGLKEALLVDTSQDEAGLVQRFGPFRRCAYAHRRERVPHTGEEGGFLRQGAAVRHHHKGVHLKAVVVVEAEGLVLDDARVELEAGGRQALAGAGVAGVQDRHVVLLGHRVDGIEQTQEVLLRVDVLLSVCAQQDVSSFLEAEAGVDVGRLDLRQVLVQHLRHRRTGHVRALLREARVGQVAAGVLAVGHVHIGDDVDNPSVGLLRQALVLAAVASLHVEDRDVQALRTNDREARVRVAQHQHCVRLDCHHQLIAFGDDIAHGLAQVRANCIHLHLRRGELQILEEHTVQVVVIVLARVRQDGVEVGTALIDHRRQPDDFRAGTDDDEKLELAVVGERDFAIVHIANIAIYSTGSKYVSGRFGSKSSFAHMSVMSGSVSDRFMMLCV